MEKNFNIREIEKEMERIDSNLTKAEQDGVRDILKYFDRIHDKLFTFNNILIAGFFTISKIDTSIPVKAILIPIVNLCFLIYIEYRMMEKSRFDATIKSQSKIKIDKQGKSISLTNNLSLLSILTTLIVTLFFLFFLTKTSNTPIEIKSTEVIEKTK